IDTNILVYAHRRDSPWHDRARAAISELVASRGAWGLVWTCLYEFYATVTRPRYYRPPSTPSQALEQIDAWLECPTVTLLAEDAGTWSVLRDLVTAAHLKGPAYHDD